MKRVLSLILIISLLLCGLNINTLAEAPLLDEQVLSGQDMLSYVESAVYAELVETLDPEMFYVEDVSTAYLSKEYLEELAYNSKANIFFGYNLDDLNAMFQGTRYVFTLDESGQTGVQEFIEFEDDTFEKVLKNVAIGTGVIMVSVTVAVVTKNPAAAVNAGKTVKLIFTVSSTAAKTGTVLALESAGICGTISAITEAFRTGNWDNVMNAGMLGASEGYKYGAIFGTVKGIADGIRIVGNTRYFPQGSEQAIKYPEGVEFTVNPDGTAYPRFEKWAKATANFDKPTLTAAQNHTGLSGNYWYDSKLANAQCGYAVTPSGYVWHHVEDMQTMILIPRDVHTAAVGGMWHTGGASLIKAFLGI